MNIQRHDKYEEYLARQHQTWAKSKPIKDWRKQMKNPKSNAELLRLVKEKCKPNTGWALDLGAGEGYHTMDLIDMGYKAVGIEVHDRRVADAKKMGRPVEHGDMHNLHFSTGAFDLVFAHEVIEHCADIDRVLNQIQRVLKIGGKFAFSLPAEGHWRPKKEAALLDKFPAGRDNHFLKTTVPAFHEALVRNGLEKHELLIYELSSIRFRGVWKPGFKVNFKPHLFVIGEKA